MREDEMDGVERGGRWKTLKQLLGFKGMGCCGASWGVRESNTSIREEERDDEEEELLIMGVGQIPAGNSRAPACVGQITAASGMNLATALAAERNLRGLRDLDGGNAGPTTAATIGTAGVTPLKTLMRLIDKMDGVDGRKKKAKKGGSDEMCCVCMERNKGAAFIPCGHTFCRICSRELWLNRGSCPICNRSILEILDIF